VFAQQTCAVGFTHGDPHPGNLLVRPRPEPPSLTERLLGGGAPRPQLVLLDHGVYVELPEALRRLYCQLWGAIVLGDWPTARLAAAALGGERAGRILPELLRPRDWRAVPPDERRRVGRGPRGWGRGAAADGSPTWVDCLGPFIRWGASAGGWGNVQSRTHPRRNRPWRLSCACRCVRRRASRRSPTWRRC
jgi:hypothetical protein